MTLAPTDVEWRCECRRTASSGLPYSRCPYCGDYFYRERSGKLITRAVRRPRTTLRPEVPYPPEPEQETLF